MLWFLAGFACQPEVELYPQVAISTTEIDFGEVPVGDWLEMPFLIENTGQVPVQILSSGIIGASESIWNLRTDGISSLGVGDYAGFTLRFSPNQMREEDVRVQIRLDIENLSTLYVNGAGMGGLSIRDLDEDGFSPAEGDCNDANVDIYPDAPEICDGEDSDCDGVLPDEEEDFDADGWLACDGDCDDYDNDVYPTAPELCDDKDNDCDGEIPDHNDNDGDGQTSCEGDCDDSNPDRWYGNAETCNFEDSDCNGLVDDIDNDGDGHSMCESGGDCDDANPLAYPVVFDSSSPYEEGDGTPAYPYSTLSAALQNIDELCRTVMIAPGTHEVGNTFLGSQSYVKIKGAGEYPDDSILVQWQGSGGRMFIVKLAATVDISNVTFFASNSPSDGAALMIKSNGTVNAENVYFIDNQTIRSGGAVWIFNGNFSCTNCEFSHNESNASGGAISVDNGSYAYLENTLFSNNIAQQAGAIAVNDSVLVTDGVLYSSNEALGEGGALAVYDGSRINSVRDRFWHNQADSNGGAIIFRNISGNMSTIHNARFQDNISFVDGGAISAVGDQASLLVANSTFVGNFAADNGGDIYFEPISSNDGLWVWSNISSEAYGGEAFYVGDGLMSSFSYNSCFSPSTGICYQAPEGYDEGFNDENDPLFVNFSDDNDPSNDDLTLQLISPALLSGPFDGQGPTNYTFWSNPDGTRNNRGYTGGVNAE